MHAVHLFLQQSQKFLLCRDDVEIEGLRAIMITVRTSLVVTGDAGSCLQVVLDTLKLAPESFHDGVDIVQHAISLLLCNHKRLVLHKVAAKLI